MLKKLLMAPQGASVEMLCYAVHVTYNAITQHLTALLGSGSVERGK